MTKEERELLELRHFSGAQWQSGDELGMFPQVRPSEHSSFPVEDKPVSVPELTSMSSRPQQLGGEEDFPPLNPNGTQSSASILDHPELQGHKELSEGEHGRFVGALKKYGIPLGFLGIVTALAARDGQGPEAAVAGFTGYLQGTKEAAERARKQMLENQDIARAEDARKAGALQALMPTMAPDAQRAAGAEIMRRSGFTPEEAAKFPMQSQEEVALAHAKTADTIQTRQTAINIGTQAAMNASTPEGVARGVAIVRRYNPELADIIQPVATAGLEGVEATDSIHAAMLSAFRPNMKPAEILETARRLSKASPEAFKDLLDSYKTVYEQEQATRRANIQASASGGGRSGGTLGERAALARLKPAALRTPEDNAAISADDNSASARSALYQAWNRAEARYLLLSKIGSAQSMGEWDKEMHRRIHRPSEEEKALYPTIEDRKQWVVSSMAQKYETEPAAAPSPTLPAGSGVPGVTSDSSSTAVPLIPDSFWTEQ
jgi:hypothetical protein